MTKQEIQQKNKERNIKPFRNKYLQTKEDQFSKKESPEVYNKEDQSSTQDVTDKYLLYR